MVPVPSPIAPRTTQLERLPQSSFPECWFCSRRVHQVEAFDCHIGQRLRIVRNIVPVQEHHSSVNSGGPENSVSVFGATDLRDVALQLSTGRLKEAARTFLLSFDQPEIVERPSAQRHLVHCVVIPSIKGFPADAHSANANASAFLSRNRFFIRYSR